MRTASCGATPMTTTRHDPRALRIAEELHRAEQPEITILFGSRARGDYKEGRSDIDVLMIRDNTPTLEKRDLIDREAEKLAQSLYGQPVTVQTIWYTGGDFDRMRRTLNHVIARALQDGIVMPKDPEDYENRYGQEQDAEDVSYEWTITEERYRHAEKHLIALEAIINSGRPDMDDMIGQQSHSALEHAMKALISARGWQYKTTHDLNQLVGDIRRADPEFQFSLTIPGSIYNQYAGREEYQHTENPLTDIPDYEEATKSDVRRLLERARESQNDQSR